MTKRQALKLARAGLGPTAVVFTRRDAAQRCWVGVKRFRPFPHCLIAGIGPSWEEALRKAGISLKGEPE